MYYTYHTGITIERPEERKQHPYIPLHSSLDLNTVLPWNIYTSVAKFSSLLNPSNPRSKVVFTGLGVFTVAWGLSCPGVRRGRLRLDSPPRLQSLHLQRLPPLPWSPWLGFDKPRAYVAEATLMTGLSYFKTTIMVLPPRSFFLLDLFAVHLFAVHSDVTSLLLSW